MVSDGASIAPEVVLCCCEGQQPDRGKLSGQKPPTVLGTMCLRYFAKDFVDNRKNRKLKPIPNIAPKHASKLAPEGKHVQLFKMKRKHGKGFYFDSE